jgi:hypothetical protein
LPEAVDPRLGYPLPTTSPLTWSAAMYVMATINYKPKQGFVLTIIMLLAVVVIMLSIIMFVVYGRLNKPYALSVTHEDGGYL